MQYEVELHYAPTEDRAAHIVILQVEASCHTELANIAYGLQTRGGHQTVRNVLTGKTRVVGLQIEHVSFGPLIARDEKGMPDYDAKKVRT